MKVAKMGKTVTACIFQSYNLVVLNHIDLRLSVGCMLTFNINIQTHRWCGAVVAIEDEMTERITITALVINVLLNSKEVQ